MLRACSCLNIKIRTQYSQPSAEKESLVPEPTLTQPAVTLECKEIHFQGTLTELPGLSAITVEIPSLMESILIKDQDIKVIRCMNCSCMAYAIKIPDVGSPSGWLPENQLIYLGNDIKDYSEMESMKSQPDYSPLFKIRVLPSKTDSCSLADQGYLMPDITHDIDLLYTTFLDHQKMETERKIAEYRDHMMMEFQQTKEKATKEKDLILMKIRSSHEHRLASKQESHSQSNVREGLTSGTTSEPSLHQPLEAPLLVSRRPRSLSNISNTAIPTPILTTSTSFKEGSQSAGKRVHFDTNMSSKSTAHESETNEEIFDLEGVTCRETDRYHVNSVSEEEEDVRSKVTPPRRPSKQRPVSPPPQLLATSLPVDIPGKMGESFDDLDSDPQFIAPHILSAQTYQGHDSYLNPSLSKKMEDTVL